MESGPPLLQAVNRDQTLGLRSVVPLASSSISSGATQSCRGAKLCFSYLPNHTLFLNRGQLRGTALHNDPPACNLFRLSATMHHSNPQTVDILCKPEENAPFPHKNRLRKRPPRPCGDQEFRRIYRDKHSSPDAAAVRVEVPQFLIVMRTPRALPVAF